MARLDRIPALLAAALAGALIALERRPLGDLLSYSDPGLQGSLSLTSLRPLLSLLGHSSVLLLSAQRVFSATPLAWRRFRGVLVCDGALGIEVLALLPCVGATDGLCGVFYLLVNPFAALAMVAGLVRTLVQSESRAFHAVALASLSLLCTGIGFAYWRCAPAAFADCARASDPLRRDACRMNFALREGDEQLCEQVDFDSSRWSCLYQIAERKRMPALCEQITAPCRAESPGLHCDPTTYRDTCFLVIARSLGEARWCEAVQEPEKRASCIAQARRP